MTTLTTTKNPILDLESLGENEKLEAYIRENNALYIFSQLEKKKNMLAYIYGATLSVISSDFDKDSKSAREKYGYNSLKDLIDNDENFDGYESFQTWYNFKKAYELAVEKGLSYKELTDNKIKYTKLLALKDTTFETKEELLEALKRPLTKQLTNNDFSTIGLPLNPQAPPTPEQSSTFTDNNDGYVYPVQQEADSEFSQENGNMEVLPPAWDNIPKTEIDARTFKTHMNTSDYIIFTEDLEALKSTLSSDLPHLFNPEANDSTLTNAVLCFITKFAWDNMDLILKQYKRDKK